MKKFPEHCHALTNYAKIVQEENDIVVRNAGRRRRLKVGVFLEGRLDPNEKGRKDYPCQPRLMKADESGS